MREDVCALCGRRSCTGECERSRCYECGDALCRGDCGAAEPASYPGGLTAEAWTRAVDRSLAWLERNRDPWPHGSASVNLAHDLICRYGPDWMDRMDAGVTVPVPYAELTDPPPAFVAADTTTNRRGE